MAAQHVEDQRSPLGPRYASAIGRGVKTEKSPMVVLRDGIQSADAIERLAQAGIIRPETPFAPDQVQPASLDLRLGKRAYRVRASFLPGRNHTVRDRLVQLSYRNRPLRRRHSGDGKRLHSGV